MTSKFLVPLRLLNLTATPATPTAGFVGLYMKNNFLTTLSSSGTELDAVLDRPLTGFVAVTPSSILSTDTVLEAFQKIQAQIDSAVGGPNDEYIQDLIFNSILAGSGVSINYDDFNNQFTISSTLVQGPLGSGTNNYLARWTPDGSTLGDSLVQDNGSSVSIGLPPNPNSKLFVLSSTNLYGVTGYNMSDNGIGVYGQADTGIGVLYGVAGLANSTSATENIGLWGKSTNGVTNYSIRLEDGTETVAGRFLKNIVNGKANWATLTTSDISDYTAYSLPIASNLILGGVKVGTGLQIDGTGILSVTPSVSYDEVVNFDQLTPTTPGVIFDPALPATINILYVSSVDSSTWIWNGSLYVTESPISAGTPFNLFGTTIDAGATKTSNIERSGKIYVKTDGSNYLELSQQIVRVVSSTNAISVLQLGSNTPSNAPTIELIKHRGTPSIPSYSQNADVLSIYKSRSSNANAFEIKVTATENHSALLAGSKTVFSTIKNGDITAEERLEIMSNGKIKVNGSYILPNVDGTVSQVLTTDGAGNLSWATPAGGGTVLGTGTTNYVARWSNTTTLAIGSIMDDGSRVSIGTGALPTTTKVMIQGLNTDPYALVVSLGRTGGGGIAIDAGSSGIGSSTNTGVRGSASNSSGFNYGGYFTATGTGPASQAIGLYAFAGSAITNYAVQLKDGTETVVNTFLKNITDGKAHWEPSFTIDSNKVAKFEGQVYSDLSTTNTPTGTIQTINFNNGNSQKLNLGSATGTVSITLTNPKPGGTYFIRIQQGIIPRAITFATTVKFPGGTAPTLTPTNNAEDTIVIFYDGTSYYGNFSLNYL